MAPWVLRESANLLHKRRLYRFSRFDTVPAFGEASEAPALGLTLRGGLALMQVKNWLEN